MSNKWPYELSAIRGGIVSACTNKLCSNNVIISTIITDDDRNDTEYQCVIAIPGTSPSTLQLIKKGNVSILYVAGE